MASFAVNCVGLLLFTVRKNLKSSHWIFAPAATFVAFFEFWIKMAKAAMFSLSEPPLPPPPPPPPHHHQQQQQQPVYDPSLISAPLYISCANLHNLKHWRGPQKNKVTNKIRAILFVPAVERRLFLPGVFKVTKRIWGSFHISDLFLFLLSFFLRELNQQQCVSLHI